jgi:multicomponent Na+:H+ antiporter subunit G
MDLVGGIALVAGACFVLLAGVGVLRFPDVFSRMHAAAKGPTLGLILTGIGVVLTLRTVAVVVTVLLVLVLQLIAGPVGSHVIGRAVYHRDETTLGTDELADEAGDPATPGPDAEHGPPTVS